MYKKIFLTIIFISICVVFFIVANIKSFAQTGTLYFSPATVSAGTGKSFTVKVMASTGDDEVNAVVANFTFPADKLKITNISSAVSVFNQTQRQEVTGNTVYIERYSSTFFKGTGEVASVTFEAIALGDADLAFTAAASLPTGYDNPPNALVQAQNGLVHILQTLPHTAIWDEKPTLVISSGAILIIGGFLLAINNKFRRRI
ncbi:MAG: cohesin domain-containing protein [bacterium]